MKYRFIRDHAGRFAVERMCRILAVSRSGYCAWRKRPESPRKIENRRLKALIRAVFTEYRGIYGSPSIHRELVGRGESIGRHRTARLMREEGLFAKQKRKFRVTTDSHHGHPVAPNLLEHRFRVGTPDTVWASDITCIPTREGWLYLPSLSISIHGWWWDGP